MVKHLLIHLDNRGTVIGTSISEPGTAYAHSFKDIKMQNHSFFHHSPLPTLFRIKGKKKYLFSVYFHRLKQWKNQILWRLLWSKDLQSPFALPFTHLSSLSIMVSFSKVLILCFTWYSGGLDIHTTNLLSNL